MSAWPEHAEAAATAPARSRRAAWRRGLLRPAAWALLLCLLLLLGLVSAAWSVAALLLYRVLPGALGRRLGRTMIAHGYACFWRVAALCGMLKLESNALDALREEPGLVLIANHPSMLDAMMLAARLPRSACIMKASLLRNPLLGPGARLARYICNDSAYGMIQSAVDDLRLGGQLLMFPEGTRTTRAPVNPFHGSFVLIAQRARAPIQTLFIDTCSPYLGKGWPLWRLPPLPIRFSVRLGRRFAAGSDRLALREQIEAYYCAELQP